VKWKVKGDNETKQTIGAVGKFILFGAVVQDGKERRVGGRNDGKKGQRKEGWASGRRAGREGGRKEDRYVGGRKGERK
jgi:hypothetical protein